VPEVRTKGRGSDNVDYGGIRSSVLPMGRLSIRDDPTESVGSASPPVSLAKYAAIWALDFLDALLGHRWYRLCHWIATSPWWGETER